MKYTLPLILLSLFVGTFVFAEAPTGTGDYIYTFHLFYDNGQILPDRDFNIKYDVTKGTYVPETESALTNFKYEIVNFKGETVKTIKFDPRQGNAKLTSGKVSIKGPYVPDASVVIFYDLTDNPTMRIFVQDSAICNDDSVCDGNRGEKFETCPNDCKQVKRQISEVPISHDLLEASGGVRRVIYFGIGGLFVIAAGVFAWAKWFRKKVIAPEVIPPGYFGQK
jgi:hypothetical protein